MMLNVSAIVEQVRDGTQLRVRLLLDDQQHQFINLVRQNVKRHLPTDIYQVVAGAKSPRAGGRDDASSAEPWGEEVRVVRPAGYREI